MIGRISKIAIYVPAQATKLSEVEAMFDTIVAPAPSNFAPVPLAFTTILTFDGRTAPASILPALRRNGMHFEVNVQGFPRFFMRWTELDRYDVLPDVEEELPYSLILAASDAIEKRVGGPRGRRHACGVG